MAQYILWMPSAVMEKDLVMYPAAPLVMQNGITTTHVVRSLKVLQPTQAKETQ